jgi:hypothetical protein
LDEKIIEDFRKLHHILKECEAIIQNIIENSQVLILKEFADDQRFMGLLKEAWGEVRTEIHMVIKKTTPKLPQFSDEHRGLWSDLKHCGLTGTQLDLKLVLFQKLQGNFKKTKAPRWTRRLLGVINSILGSLSSIFPGIEVVSELKDVLEQVIKIRK